MRAKTQWKSVLPHFRGNTDDAKRKALIAAAQILVNRVKKDLRGGYTSGDFVTGAAMNSVTKSEPYDADGTMTIDVGTPLLYPLFWELGHHNLYTRKYERKEIWMPAAVDTREAQKAAYNRVFIREMKK